MSALRVLGRAASINVRKVLWTGVELGLDLVREDVDVKAEAFRVLNPNAMMPVLIDAQAGPGDDAGTPFSMLAVHRTRVAPNSASTEPSACAVNRRVKRTGRSSSGARPPGRMEVSVRDQWRQTRLAAEALSLCGAEAATACSTSFWRDGFVLPFARAPGFSMEAMSPSLRFDHTPSVQTISTSPSWSG